MVLLKDRFYIDDLFLLAIYLSLCEQAFDSLQVVYIQMHLFHNYYSCLKKSDFINTTFEKHITFYAYFYGYVIVSYCLFEWTSWGI